MKNYSHLIYTFLTYGMNNDGKNRTSNIETTMSLSTKYNRKKTLKRKNKTIKHKT